ncbi:ankyrin [Atractiella rhizophila]|nr:ankyrin [Atractiella rhizophila]
MDEPSNIWTAVSDGDLERVKYLIETEGVSPNAKDENSYTPLHAAVSWNQKEILKYLIEKGGDINIKDDDGETPIYTVEEEDMLRLVLELGADPAHQNAEGITPAVSLSSEYPSLSSHLISITHEVLPSSSSSQHGDTEADALAQQLISQFNVAMAQEGMSEEEREKAIMDLVQDAVAGQVEKGRDMEVDEEGAGTKRREGDEADVEPAGKRRRAEDEE